MEIESQKLLIPRENTRTAKSIMPTNEKPQPPSPPILDRFRALLKQREEDSDGDLVPPLSTEEIVALYELLLAELTFNSKPIITDLTIIAGEQREHAEGIADAICARILEVPVEQKLPSLYLLDSIVKNIGREYVSYFSLRLPEVFCEAYRQVHPNMYPSMRHLFGTWSTVFPLSALRKIETELQFSPQVKNQSSGLTSLTASEPPRPTHGIHVNPKYLRQLEHASADNVGAQRLNTTGGMGRPSYTPGTNKLHPSSTSKLARPLSPSRIGADRPLSSEVDDFATGNSPQRFEGVSPSRPVFDYGRGRGLGRGDEMNEWRRKRYSDDKHNRVEASVASSLSNGHELQGPRALIDAYGDDRGKRIPNSKPLQVELLDVNGVGKVTSRSWQNTEEEEFDWEDMSPTLAEHGRSNDFLPSSVQPFGAVGTRPGFVRPSSAQSESDIRSNRTGQAQLPFLNDSSNIAEDIVSILGSSRGSTGKTPGLQTERTQFVSSRYPQEPWKLPHHFPQSTHLPNAKGRGRDFQMPMPFSGSGVSSTGGENLASVVDKLPDTDAQLIRPPTGASRMGSTVDSITSGTWSGVVPSSTGLWPPVNVHKSHPPPMLPIFPPHKETRSQFDPINAGSTIVNQGLHKSSFVSEQPFNSFESKELGLMKQPPFPYQPDALNQRNQAQVNPFRPQFPTPDARDNFPPSAVVSLPPHPLALPPLNHGYSTQGNSAGISMVPSNPVPVVQLPLPVNNIPNTLHQQVGLRPPLPPGPPPTSQMIPIPQNAGPIASSQQQGGGFSGLINSLMAQGLISLTKQTPVQDSIGLEFNADLLKVRLESAITALYADLPRQCTTCGLRFKCQEEHSSHMDWHVTKNRMSKSRKQKPSRKWFVSASMWLSGAEALGTEAVPGFLPTETVVEKKDDEELAVPADEEQNACALCGEPFDDFYSDETEEWMYRGAIYLNAPNGSTAGMDRSQLGPIVHAKCRSESSVVLPEDFRNDEGGNTEEGSHRKRMRS